MGRNPGIPHYRKIADAILASLDGRQDRKLPSQRAIAKRYNVAKGTARRALEELGAQGFVNALPGSGTFASAKTARIVYAFGYLLDHPISPHVRFFAWLTHLLAEQGIHLIVRDIGLYGERIDDVFDAAEIARAEMVIWQVTTHPDGVKAATRARRHLPKDLPLVLINDPLGLSLQGGHRFDLLHHDFAVAARDMVIRLAKTGSPHPIWVSRSDYVVFSEFDAQAGFLHQLRMQGIANPEDHVVTWDVTDLRFFRKFFAESRNWQPTSMILPYPFKAELGPALRREKIPLPADFHYYSIGRDYADFQLSLDWREMAEVCANLALTRLSRPMRQNLRVAVNVPVRRRKSKAS